MKLFAVVDNGGVKQKLSHAPQTHVEPYKHGVNTGRLSLRDLLAHLHIACMWRSRAFSTTNGTVLLALREKSAPNDIKTRYQYCML